MTQTEALAKAREIMGRKLPHEWWKNPIHEQTRRFETILAQALLDAVREEREQCAKICADESHSRSERAANPLPGDEHIPDFNNSKVQSAMSINAFKLSQAIRQRGEPEHGDQG